MASVPGLKHGSHTLGQHRLQEERESSATQLRAGPGGAERDRRGAITAGGRRGGRAWAAMNASCILRTANSASVTRTGRWAEASACSSSFFNLYASDMGEIAVQRLPGTAFLETLVSREAVALQHAGAWLEEEDEDPDALGVGGCGSLRQT